MSNGCQQGSALAEAELSHWQVLQQKMKARQQAPAVPDDDAENMLKSIFLDHVLADYPDFISYFKNEKRGRPMFERQLRKAQAAHAAVVHHRAGVLARGLARYRASPLRVWLHLLLSCPEYSPLALAIGVLMLAVVVLNTVTFCMESVPAYEGTTLYDRLIIVDYVCLGIFTTEFVLRLAVCNSFRKFAMGLMNWVDLAAIAPFLLELAIEGPDSQNASQTRIFRLMRLVRVMRLLRASTKFRNLQIVVDALSSSLDVIAMLGVLLAVLLVVAGSVVYYVEGALVSETWFDSIPLTIYYMHVTLTTTGYGDFYAQSAWGRFVVGSFMLLCMVTVSLPIGVVGGNFSGLWSRYCGLRDACARSLGAWANRRRLRRLAPGHCAAADELLAAANAVKVALEEGSPAAADAACGGGGGGGGGAPDDGSGLWSLRDGVAGLQIRMQLAATKGQDISRTAPLRESVSELRERLWTAADRQAQLKVLLSLAARASPPELASSLESVHEVHTSLARRAAEAARGAARARALLGELRALREVVREEEEAVYGVYDMGERPDDAAAVARKL